MIVYKYDKVTNGEFYIILFKLNSYQLDES